MSFGKHVSIARPVLSPVCIRRPLATLLSGLILLVFMNGKAGHAASDEGRPALATEATTSVIIIDHARFTTDSLKSHDVKTTGDLVIIISGLSSDKGHVRVGLFDDVDGWPAEWTKNSAGWGDAAIRKGRAVYQFRNLPAGMYALNGYHDENDNGKLDAGLFGIPKEGFCFSTDYKPLVKAPSFTNVEFLFKPREKSNRMVIQITMQYR